MIPPTLFPGANYIDATEHDHVAMIWESHFDTSHGRVELPFGQSVHDVSLADDGMRFTGKGHDGPVKDQCVEWLGVEPWFVRGPAHGSRACIYDAQGRLTVSRPVAENTLGTEGWRFVNDAGVLVPGRDSLVAAPDGRGIWEFVQHGGITIGQGGDGPHGADPVIAIYGGKRRVLLDGKNYNIKFRLYGDLIVAAWWAVDLKSAALLRISVADLAQFPEQQFTPVVVIVPPVDKDKPKEKPVSLPDPGAVKAALDIERAKYGATLSNDECVAMLNAAALKFPGMGMMSKHGDTSGRIGNTTVDNDTLRFLPDGDNYGWWSDVLGATGAGLATPLAPEWKRSTDDRASFVAPVPVKGVPPVVIGDKPVPVSGSIDSAVTTLIANAVAPLVAKIAALQTQLDELKARPVGGGAAPSINGLRIALIDDLGNVVSVRHDESGLLRANRLDVGPWEGLTVQVLS